MLLERNEVGEAAASATAGMEFARRAEPVELPELMDEPASYEELRACLRDLAQVNLLTGAFRPTREFLNRVVERADVRERLRVGEPLRVLDVGSGYGDMLRRVYRWAGRRGIRVELMGVDLNPHATRAADEATAAQGFPAGAICWATGNAFSLAEVGEPDVVVSSLLTHHLPTSEVVRFLGWMEDRARVGWFVNDLERQPRPARVFSAVGWALRWHRFVRHDGPVSFRRAFRTEDWERMLAAAEVPAAAARVMKVFPGRMCVERLRS